MTTDYQQLIEQSFVERAAITPETASKPLIEAVNYALDGLETGLYRVAEKKQNTWIVHPWLKKAVLLYFRLHTNQVISAGFTHFYDKVPLRFQDNHDDIKTTGVRVVPPACVRKGAFVGRNTILMPSYVNIGAYIGEGTMVDTWSTVGSCAQIGKNVHISGGVGIGGVLEPLQANPTIIEDNCFIGARSEVVEGMIIEQGAVISMGVYLGQSTKIYDRTTDQIFYGKIPAGSVVVPGNLPADNGKYSLYCAVIVKKVDEKTKQKVGINQLLREAVSS